MTSSSLWRVPTFAALLFALSLLLAGCGSAPGRLVLLDEGRALDPARVEAAAEPLVGRGATVAVFVVSQGDGRGEDFARRLDSAGLLRDGRIAPRAIGVYVSSAPRYSELRVGEPWSGAVSSDELERIRREVLNPALRDERFTDGIAAAVAAIESPVAGYERWSGAVRILPVALAVAATLLLIFGSSLWWTVRESPPGRLVAWLWARTPPGRGAERRRREQASGAARRALEDSMRRAHGRLEDLKKLTATPWVSCDELDRRYAGLLGRSADDAGLADELQALRAEYEQVAAQLSALTHSYSQLASAASGAREQVGRTRAAFDRPPPRVQRRKGGGTSWRPVSAAGVEQLAALQARLGDLDVRRAALALASSGDGALQQQLKELLRAYQALAAEGESLWRRERPEAYAAHIARLRAADTDWSTDSSSAGSSYGSSGSSSSSSDWSSSSSSDWSSSSSDSGGESRAGGDW